MIQEFVDKFIAKQNELFTEEFPDSYEEIVKAVIDVINPEKEYDLPDSNRIHQIDDGDYQGTLLFVIAACGYQPSDYWYVKVDYGSCSGCDTFQEIYFGSGDNDSIPTKQQAKDYQTLALHIVQDLKKME